MALECKVIVAQEEGCEKAMKTAEMLMGGPIEADELGEACIYIQGNMSKKGIQRLTKGKKQKHQLKMSPFSGIKKNENIILL